MSRISTRMEEIRNNVADRIIGRIEALHKLGEARALMYDIDPEHLAAGIDGSRDFSPDIVALKVITERITKSLRHDTSLDLVQYGKLLARDVIAPIARDSTEPTAWLTGNRFFPAIREVDRMDDIWDVTAVHGHGDMNEDFWSLLIEVIEQTLNEEQVCMTAPEDDNSLYVVDLKRWEHVENENVYDINEEWQTKNA